MTEQTMDIIADLMLAYTFGVVPAAFLVLVVIVSIRVLYEKIKYDVTWEIQRWLKSRREEKEERKQEKQRRYDNL